MTEQERRALAAYYRAGASAAPADITTVTVDGLKYIVLHDGTAVDTVYRVLAHRDALKRLRRWAPAVATAVAEAVADEEADEASRPLREEMHARLMQAIGDFVEHWTAEECALAGVSEEDVQRVADDAVEGGRIYNDVSWGAY